MTPARTSSILVLTALLSLAFRLGPLDFGMVGDEHYVTDNLEGFFMTGTARPEHHITPPLSHYICWLSVAAAVSARGDGSLYEDFAWTYFLSPETILMFCRRTYWTVSVLTPPVLLLLCLLLFRSWEKAALAGIFLAVSIWQVSLGRLALSNTMMTLLFTVSVCLSIHGARESKIGWAYAGAFAGGLGMACKMTGLMAAFPAAATVWALSRTERKSENKAADATVLIAAGLGAAAVSALYFSGAWRPILLAFSRDGDVDPEYQSHLVHMLRRAAQAGAGLVALDVLLAWRLFARDRGDVLGRFTKHLDRTLGFVADPPIYLAGTAFLSGFLIFNPYWIVDFKKFAVDVVLGTIQIRYVGHQGMDGQDWIWYLSRLWSDEGSLALVFGAGLIAALLRSDRSVRASAVFILLMFYGIGAWEEKALRFLSYLVPLACLVSASGLIDLAGRGRAARLTLGVLAAMVVFSQWISASALRSAGKLPDSRMAAKAWIEENIPSGNRVVQTWYAPEIRTRTALERIRTRTGGAPISGLVETYMEKPVYEIFPVEAWDRERFCRERGSTLVLSSWAYDRFLDPGQTPPPEAVWRSEDFRKWRGFYEAFLRGSARRYATLLAVFGPDHYSDPEIRIYRIKGCAGS